MYTQFNYLSADILNNIEQKMQDLYQKYSCYTSRTYESKTWEIGELVYVDEIANIEEAIEYLGTGFGYPKGWIVSRNWNTSKSNNISYKDINRILNNIDVLDRGNFVPLLPNDNLYPSDNLYPRNSWPKDYTRVEYIESTGTQYIDTGIKGTLNTEIIANATISQNNAGQFFGDITTQSAAISCNASLNTALVSRFGNKSSSISFGNYITQNNIFEIKENKDGIYINSEQIASFETTDDFTTAKNLLVFTRNSNTLASFWHGKIFSFKILENNVLVRDFIPCYRNSDNEVGLYDLITNRFFTNQGTGNFIYGEE